MGSGNYASPCKLVNNSDREIPDVESVEWTAVHGHWSGCSRQFADHHTRTDLLSARQCEAVKDIHTLPLSDPHQDINTH